MKKIEQKIPALEAMKKYPHEITYEGELCLLERKKISIVGSRKPSKYARELTYEIANKIAKAGGVVVSGGAMGIDAVAHQGASPANTIAVLPCGILHKYPAVNKNLLQNIASQGLVLSQFEPEFTAKSWSFVVRNELVVALGEMLIVSEAEIGSGSERSIEYALAMKRDIYVLPHRAKESSATNMLLQKGLARAIYDVDSFISEHFGTPHAKTQEDDFLRFCRTNPTYEEATRVDAQRLFELELSGEIEVVNGRIRVLA